MNKVRIHNHQSYRVGCFFLGNSTKLTYPAGFAAFFSALFAGAIVTSGTAGASAFEAASTAGVSVFDSAISLTEILTWGM